MLMHCLAAGRAISLPALGAAMQRTALFVVTGYGRIREQFGLPIGKFQAVAALIAEIAQDRYASDAARRFTAAALDGGGRPSVASAILKVQLIEAGRRAVNHGMDILGGKGIIRGPGNLLAVAYGHAPIDITVEDANLMSRALIIFGQGAVRCHLQVLAEMNAVERNDADALGQALLAHAGHLARKLLRSLAGARLLGEPPADLTMGLLGGQLKRMALLSARLGDVLSALYLAAACVWRYEVEAEPAMLALARAAIGRQLAGAARALRELVHNLPSKPLVFIAPLLLRGTRQLRPVDDTRSLALDEALRSNKVLISRLCPDVGVPRAGGLRDLMQALKLAQSLGDEWPALNKQLRRSRSLEEAAAGASDPAAALAYLRAADRVIQVDDFAP